MHALAVCFRFDLFSSRIESKQLSLFFFRGTVGVYALAQRSTKTESSRWARSTHLAFKSIHFVHVHRLVVSAEKMHAIRVHKLPAKEDKHVLERERTTVDIVAVEKIRVLWRGKSLSTGNNKIHAHIQ